MATVAFKSLMAHSQVMRSIVAQNPDILTMLSTLSFLEDNLMTKTCLTDSILDCCKVYKWDTLKRFLEVGFLEGTLRSLEFLAKYNEHGSRIQNLLHNYLWIIGILNMEDT